MDESNSSEGENPKPAVKIESRATYQSPPAYQTRSVSKTAGKNTNSPKVAKSNSDSNELSNEELIDNNSESESNSENEKKGKKQQEEVHSTSFNYFYVVAAIAGIVAFSFGNFMLIGTTNENNPGDINLEELFPSKNPDFWATINAGINEVKKYDKPSVFIFLYTKLVSEEYIDNFIGTLSEVASYRLNGNGSPTIINEKEFNSPEAIKDYGYNIAKYKPLLESGSVLSVKHLNLVKPEVAKAFHTLCDDISPLVNKSLFFFTMKVDETSFGTKKDSHLVMDRLKKQWSVLPDDIFTPLFARISNNILKITPST